MYTIRISMKYTHFCATQTTNLFLIEPLADKIAEPRPDMNIKVAAFTVSEKSINICMCSYFTFALFTGLILVYPIAQTLR